MFRMFTDAFIVPAVLFAPVISYPEVPPEDVVDDRFGIPGQDRRKVRLLLEDPGNG